MSTARPPGCSPLCTRAGCAVSGPCWEAALTIAGTPYAHGLSVRSPNRVEVHSAVPMARLEAVIGVDDAAPEPHGVRFNVKPGMHWVGQKLYEGTVLERGQPGQRIAVELGGIPCMTLETLQPPESKLETCGIWAEAVVTLADGSTLRLGDLVEQPDGWRQTLAPFGGRPSNRVMPFFTLDGGGRGLVLAIGWSGQWRLGGSRQGDRLRGGELAALTVSLPSSGTCALISYQRLP